MSLQIIRGSSGSGKSYYLYENIIKDSISHPENNYIVIVPEQFTMGTQEKIVEMHPSHGVLNIDIVSFQRLAYKVFEELGLNDREILDDTGKSLIIRKVLEDRKGLLTGFKKNADKPGFVEEVKSAISEMLQYGVTMEALMDARDKLSDKKMLMYKLGDIITVYDGFKEYAGDKYIASEEILDMLCRVTERSKMLKNSIITLDGFTGFTPIQYRLIKNLMQCAKNIYITVTIDSREKVNIIDSMTGLFDLSKKTILNLYRIADETGTQILTDIAMDDAVPRRLMAGRGLVFLEKNIFRYGKMQFEGNDGSISIYEGNMPKNEIVFVAGEIKRLINEKKYHFRDFAVVSADIETYGELTENILLQNGIKTFLDYKKNVCQNSAVAYIRGALSVIENNFSYESVFTFLKTGFSDISMEDVDILENYCLAMGIKGFKRYSSLWIRKTALMEKNGTSIERLNEIREVFLSEICGLYEEIKEAGTVKQYSRALYNFMLHGRLYEKLYKKSAAFSEAGMQTKQDEYRQIYGKIIKMLDKFVALLGDEKVSFKEFCDILDAGFSEIKVGFIPQTKDAVIIGDIERTRIENIKVLFFVGLNDGIVPRHSDGGGIITEADKEALNGLGVELSMTEREKAFIQRFYLYLTMTKPKEALYLSYARNCADGSAKKMSYLLVSIIKLFPDIRILNDATAGETLRLINMPKSRIEWGFADELLDEGVAKGLYGDRYLTSISAIEKFRTCAFAHFITYGLRLSEREMYDVQAADIGTLYHNTLERFSNKLIKLGRTFTDISDDERQELVKESVMEITTDYKNTVLYSSKRNEYLISRVTAMADRTIWAITKQLEHGKFVPREYEKSFVLSKKLTGRIDRIDLYEDDENVYVKIVDYKTGEADFDLLETYYGLKIQLITYMNAALEMEKNIHKGKNIIPAGMFYYNIRNPFVDETEDVDRAILEKLRVRGIVNSRDNVLDALDDRRDGKSLVIPVTFKNDKTAKEASGLLTPERISDLSEYVDGLIDSSIRDILSGDIEVFPYMKEGRTGCDYCGYRQVCGFDRKISDCKYNNLKSLSEDEIFELIKNK